MPNDLDLGRDRTSLCEVLDRVLNAGVVVVGEVVISVANVDLIYLGLQLTLTSVETAQRRSRERSEGEDVVLVAEQA